MKYEFIEEHRETYKAKSMCGLLKVSRSGYYAWNTRQPSRRQKDNEELLEHIQRIHTHTAGNSMEVHVLLQSSMKRDTDAGRTG